MACVKDAIISISFQTKPDKDKQTNITAELSQYFTSRKCQIVIQQDVSADVGWSLVLLVRIPSTSDQRHHQPKLRSMRQYIHKTLKSERLGGFKDHSVEAAECDAAQSRALDLGLCQDQSVDALPCVQPGSAASGFQAIRFQPQLESNCGQNTIFQNSISGTHSAQETPGDYQDPHSALFFYQSHEILCMLNHESVLSQAAILTTWLGRRAAAA